MEEYYCLNYVSHGFNLYFHIHIDGDAPLAIKKPIIFVESTSPTSVVSKQTDK